jgi:cytochrome c oxidase subunit 3
MDINLKNNTSKQLLWIGMAGISMFFAGLTSAVIVRSAEHGWDSIVMPEWFWYSTAAIIMSSIFLIIAKMQVRKGISPTPYIVSSLILGLLFSYFQIMGWNQLTSEGRYFVGPGSNPASSFLYVITFAHLMHVLGGIISLLVTTIKSVQVKYTKENYLGIELTSIYWHFLDVLWVYLFIFLLVSLK